MLRLAALLAAAIVAAPLVSLAATALSGGSGALSHLAGSVLPDALRQTTALLGGVAILAGSIGVAAAWLVTAFRFPGSRHLAWMLALPLAVPPYVTALVYVEILDAAGPVRSGLRAAFGRPVADGWFPEVRSLPSAVVLLSFVLYPYVFVAARAAFLAIDPAVLAASRMLGGSAWATFLRVGLPLARPGIAAGLTLALLEALNDIGAAEHLGVRTLTVSAYTAWLARSDLIGAAQISCAALAAVALILALDTAIERRGRLVGMTVSTRRTPRTIRGGRALAATVVCAVPVLLGFAVPAAFLAREVIRRDLVAEVDPGFVRHLATSILLGGTATLLVLAVAIPVVLSVRAAPTRIARSVASVATLGYAVPGTVLVLGLLAPLLTLDRAAGTLWEALSGRRTDLLLMGSGAAIVIAYLIRFLRAGTAPLAAQLARTPHDVEGAARVLGARPFALATSIQLPILRPALSAAGLLTFAECVKELPATLLLRPLNVETLATLVYGANARGLFEEGALAALLIVAVGLAPVIWLTRSSLSPSSEGRARSRLRRPPSPSRSARSCRSPGSGP